MSTLTIGPSGEIALPDELRLRYRMSPATAVRVVETKRGILLIPLTREPMSEELERELAEWQSLAVPAWEMFEFKDSGEAR